MLTNTFQVTVEVMPRKRLLGNWMFLNAASDQEDLRQLHRAFSRRVSGFGSLEGRTVYGVCANMRENLDCNYWTAIEAPTDGFVPQGMVPLTLDEGLYACVTTSGLTLAESFDFLNDYWNETLAIYVVDRTKPCYEVLEENWDGHSVKIFIPLKIARRCGQKKPVSREAASPLN